MVKKRTYICFIWFRFRGDGPGFLCTYTSIHIQMIPIWLPHRTLVNQFCRWFYSYPFERCHCHWAPQIELASRCDDYDDAECIDIYWMALASFAYSTNKQTKIGREKDRHRDREREFIWMAHFDCMNAKYNKLVQSQRIFFSLPDKEQERESIKRMLKSYRSVLLSSFVSAASVWSVEVPHLLSLSSTFTTTIPPSPRADDGLTFSFGVTAAPASMFAIVFSTLIQCSEQLSTQLQSFFMLFQCKRSRVRIMRRKKWTRWRD